MSDMLFYKTSPVHMFSKTIEEGMLSIEQALEIYRPDSPHLHNMIEAIIENIVDTVGRDVEGIYIDRKYKEANESISALGSLVITALDTAHTLHGDKEVEDG
jgi:hypothetical protein